jgi:hypothetical protein
MVLEQDVIERGNRLINVSAGSAAMDHLDGELIDAGQISGDIEIGIVALGDRQGRATEVDFLIASVDGLTKFAIGILSQRGPVS